MVIHSADFVKSSGKWQECPEATLPEYAFIGRSNVGKSSLINAMMGRKNLAKTSQTPGKTQLINHFLVNENWYLTDLPGYGYAKVSKSNRKEFAKLITNYILNRCNLVNLFVLVDSRHAPQQIDLDFMQWCGESGIPFSLIFTKTDKLTAGKLQENIKHYQDVLLQNWEILPEMYFTSAEKRTGTENILDFIQATNEYLIKNKVKFL